MHMESYTPLFVAALPLIVTALTSVTKRIPVFANIPESARPTIIRFVVALWSLLGAGVIYMLGGDPITSTSIEEFVIAFVGFLGAIGGHELLKRKD